VLGLLWRRYLGAGVSILEMGSMNMWYCGSILVGWRGRQ
jgi:hypothetical protein